MPMGTLGSLTVSGLWPNGSSFEVRIGSGFTTEQRDLLWKRRESLPGEVVKFKYFAGGVKEAPRFPIFLGFRDLEDM